MSKLMMTVKIDPEHGSTHELREQLGLSAGELDEDFGVVNVDPEENLYAIMVDESAAQRLTDVPSVQGPFSNPRIEPFGPPKR